MSTKTNTTTKTYLKGLPLIIAESVKCSPRYVKDVLKGKYDDRDTELVKTIKTKATDIERILTEQ